MKYNYITIEREYGSGGTEISQKLSAVCGIPAYGREILEMVSEKYNIPVPQIEKYEEKTTNSFIYSVYMMSKSQSADSAMLSNESGIYVAEQNIIRSLAQNGPAIFLGRCACEALKDRTDVLRVFIRASKDFKINRSINIYNLDENDAEAVVRRYDKKRRTYYQTNTGKRWDDVCNYDIVLDSGTLGTDGCVAAIKALI